MYHKKLEKNRGVKVTGRPIFIFPPSFPFLPPMLLGQSRVQGADKGQFNDVGQVEEEFSEHDIESGPAELNKDDEILGDKVK